MQKTAEINLRFFTLVLQAILFTHYFGYYIHDFIVAATATCRAFGNVLNILKGFFDIIEMLFVVKNIFNIGIGHLFTFADSIIFHKITFKIS